jgi:catechol 2,3-dioxygenase-like lactoylglutathione lyase family enzyme
MRIPALISIATLGVLDLTRSTKFYQALGWELSASSSPEISFFHTAGGVLALYPFDLLAKDANLPPNRRDGFGGITLAINVERPDLVQPALDAAANAGGEILKPATNADWGGVSGYFADPDGYPWEVAWNPNSRFKPDGSLDMG